MTRLTPEQVAEIAARDALWLEFVCDVDGAQIPARVRLQPDAADRHALLAHIEALEADLAACRRAIQDAINYANGRESEWGDRAEGAFAFLYTALSAQAGKGE